MYILTDQWGDESRPVSEGIEEELAAYVDAWTPQQPGIILERVPGEDSAQDSNHAPTAVGAAWLRTFTSEAPGAGFVSDDYPEVAVALRPEVAGHGRGTALMQEMLRVAREEGFPGVSLAVDVGNDRARHVYRKLGYVDSTINGGYDTSGSCHVMVYRFD
ncbi:MAG TPA: GNAT family N-acetyltransferase [Candidatus Corynebacterium avicola]|uniref:GNAT family N-acetyltransferase n=1 Tax=Candidatus Corynebacterium avicola TaxID=2838527 RepID=A0A9D1UK19_9CORY|nr:GNAT family N-acetyltransferase [Candidatus Corynebacterium avicola]